MELLVDLIGEFLGGFATIALVPLGTLAIALGEILLELICKLRGLPSLFRARVQSAAVVTWTRRVGIGLLGIFLLLGVFLVLLNTVFFESTLRWGLARSREKSGIDIRFDAARGSFLTGEVVLRGVTLRRQEALRSSIDLKIKEAKADVSFLSLLGSSPRLQVLRLSDLEGSYQRGQAPSAGRDFIIDVLQVENASLVLREPGPAPSLAITIDRLECRPLRRESAVFDVLFRSNGRGTIAGAPFEIQTEQMEKSRKTVWKAQGIPVEFIAAYVGEPLDWFTAGTVDVDVHDSWSDGESAEIDTHWKLTFRNVSAEVPARISGFKRAVAEPVVRFVKAHPAELPLEFLLKLEKGHFSGAASVETTGLLEAAADGVLHELARRAQVPATSLRELGRRGVEKFRTFLEERKRKKPED